MFLGLTVAIVSFAVVAAVLSKGNIESSASISENFSGTVDLVGVYLLGGVVAFDAVVQYPASITPVWSMWRVFQLTANKFAASFDVPSIHAEYTDISNDYNGNVYTMLLLLLSGLRPGRCVRHHGDPRRPCHSYLQQGRAWQSTGGSAVRIRVLGNRTQRI
jgi:hypothetical protein